MFLPTSWDDAHAEFPEETELIRWRRSRTQIPDSARYQLKLKLALEMIDELVDWGCAPPVVVADADYGDRGLLRTALTTRGIYYVTQIKSSTSMYPATAVYDTPLYAGFGRPRKPGYTTTPVRAEGVARSLSAEQFQEVTWRMGSRFDAARVLSLNRKVPRNPDGTLPAVWLLVQWPTGEDHPTDYWLATLPETTPIKQLVRLGKIRWRIEHDYRELKQAWVWIISRGAAGWGGIITRRW